MQIPSDERLPHWVIEFEAEIGRVLGAPQAADRFRKMFDQWLERSQASFLNFKQSFDEGKVYSPEETPSFCLLPLENRVYSLEEQYVVLALIHDLRAWEGVKICTHEETPPDPLVHADMWLASREACLNFVRCLPKEDLFAEDQSNRVRKMIAHVENDLDSLVDLQAGKSSEADGLDGVASDAESEESPPALMGASELATWLRIPQNKREAFVRQLDRERKRNALDDRAWREAQNTGPREPKFLYRANAECIIKIAKKYTQ